MIWTTAISKGDRVQRSVELSPNRRRAAAANCQWSRTSGPFWRVPLSQNFGCA